MSTTVTPQIDPDVLRSRIERFRQVQSEIVTQVRRVIVGQEEVLEQVMIGLFVGGHCLITGLPGTAKTLLVRTMAQTLGLVFKRIQFTPDLMPSDITGTDIIEEDPSNGRRTWTFVKGPIFANILLADEINRTPPKTQSALLEAMQELACTVRGNNYKLDPPFFVLATQNPIELEGTYPLPEAQLDRFMFNVVMDYLPEEDEVAVVQQTTARRTATIEPLFTGEDVLRFHELVRQMPIAQNLIRYAVRLTAASRPQQKNAPQFVNDWVSWGAGTRACQFLVLGAKARALVQGRTHVSSDDIRVLAAPVLRHRILVNYRAEAEGTNVEAIIRRLLETVKEL
jgi:MoxR-like ATPase